MNKIKIIPFKIHNRKWEARFINTEQMRKGDIGTCWSYKLTIDIDNSLGYEEAKIILAHELTHAFLSSCGCTHQDKLNQENICDFVGWNIDEMIAVRDKILKAVFK